ncbi:MAG: shikimate dehydrogenase [Burkholderiales bacterium]
MIRGTTTLIAHLGFPTEAFKAPLIYNPYFEQAGIDAVVVPMGVTADAYPQFLKLLFRLSNIGGALVTMPHKVTTVALLDEATPAVRVAGSCNAVRRAPDGRLQGDIFDGEGFVRAVVRKGRRVAGARVLVVGSGGAGAAIAASCAAAGAGALSLFDLDAGAAEALGRRLRVRHPALAVTTGARDPAGCDIVVNATPLGMRDGDPLPIDAARLDRAALVGDVVMKQELTPLLRAARDRGCAIQVGTDMLFEQIPAYLEFFGLPAATPEQLRAVARIEY